MSEIKNQVGMRIKMRRKELGMTQEALGAVLFPESPNVQVKVSVLENKRPHKDYNSSTLMALSKALDVSIDWLCGQGEGAVVFEKCEHCNGDGILRREQG
jgi:transcriptional regulator with XRE-family HTH domain